jgi:hypothetical protein
MFRGARPGLPAQVQQAQQHGHVERAGQPVEGVQQVRAAQLEAGLHEHLGGADFHLADLGPQQVEQRRRAAVAALGHQVVVAQVFQRRVGQAVQHGLVEPADGEPGQLLVQHVGAHQLAEQRTDVGQPGGQLGRLRQLHLQPHRQGDGRVQLGAELQARVVLGHQFVGVQMGHAGGFVGRRRTAQLAGRGDAPGAAGQPVHRLQARRAVRVRLFGRPVQAALFVMELQRQVALVDQRAGGGGQPRVGGQPQLGAFAQAVALAQPAFGDESAHGRLTVPASWPARPRRGSAPGWGCRTRWRYPWE